jgi:organic radical activating enzyme
MFKKNCCDGLYNSFDVHFTSACDNKCEHCIDQRFNGVGVRKPDPDAIIKTILENQEGYDDVLFLGGEPCLYLSELLYCVKELKQRTALKVFVTTAVPKICQDREPTFQELLRNLDGINLSVQHHIETLADHIRGTSSEYDRQAFYAALPNKEKIRINLNLVQPWLANRFQITSCIQHYDAMGFNEIKLSEIQHGADQFVSFEKAFELKMGSPFFSGCQKYLKNVRLIPEVKTPVLLKRSCFLCEDTLKASLMDGVKVVQKFFNKPDNKYAVVYGDGTLSKGWK